MEVVLKQDVKRLGKKDDLVDVSSGYGRNYLLPRGLAVLATKGQKTRVEKLQSQKEEKKAQDRQAYSKILQEIDGSSLTIAGNANVEGNLFGSIQAADVADVIERQYGYTVEDHYIHIPKQIKHVGTYEVSIAFDADIKANITLHVVSEN